MQINASFNNNASFFLLSASFANFNFWKFSCLWYQVGVQSRSARGQRGFCVPFLIRCSFVLPCCNTAMSGNPSAVLQLQAGTQRDLPPPSCSPTPGLFSVSWECGVTCRSYRQESPRTSLHTPSTMGNCSGYYCNTSRKFHVSSAGKPKLSSHKDSSLTPPVLDTVCSLTNHLCILSCHYIVIVLHALLCKSWLYIQSDAASNQA